MMVSGRDHLGSKKLQIQMKKKTEDSGNQQKVKPTSVIKIKKLFMDQMKPKAFISFVEENQFQVEKLVEELENNGMDVWYSKRSIRSGSDWEHEIKKGIEESDFFIACFSNEYTERYKTYMNVELNLMIMELAKIQPDQIYFIPVLLSECDVPNQKLFGTKTFRSFQYVELYNNWDQGIEKILTSMNLEKTTNLFEPTHEKFSAFSIVSFNCPDIANKGEEVTISFEIKNLGGERDFSYVSIEVDGFKQTLQIELSSDEATPFEFNIPTITEGPKNGRVLTKDDMIEFTILVI